MSAASGAIFAAAPAESWDRLDVVPTLDSGDRVERSFYVEQIADIAFPSLRGNFSSVKVTLAGGSSVVVPMDGSALLYTHADPGVPHTVAARTDYNSRIELAPMSACLGEEVAFDSTYGLQPSALHVLGVYTGIDYAADPGFLAPAGMGNELPRYSFSMPFEPVVISLKEYQPRLYNNIPMPEEWPPRLSSNNGFAPMEVPWLAVRVDTVDVSVGRQLLFDDFLIESTDLERRFHHPIKYPGNPVLSAVKSDKQSSTPGAMAKDGGVWWEPREQKYKMWYEAGWYGRMALATSADGLTWERPDVADTGSNILPSLAHLKCNSSAVVLDYDAPDAERYKMFFRQPNAQAPDYRGVAMVSADGIEWTDLTPTGICGDRSTMFYNPFRHRWVYSIRCWDLAAEPYGRCRYYREHPDFLVGADWDIANGDDVHFWCQADYNDIVDPLYGAPQLYNITAVAYESVMIGMHQLLADENNIATAEGRPKYTSLYMGFSRDGFHWYRPDREPFIACTRQPGDWDRGYVQSVGGVCAVTPDSLLFYYTGFAGNDAGSMHANGATGVATMRRDGFASLHAGPTQGTLTTCKIISDHPNRLFVNTDCAAGALLAELLDENLQPIAGFAKADCNAISLDSTAAMITWRGGDPSEVLTPGTPFRIRFYLTGGDLYSFWLSPDDSGRSLGYVGAGGPAYPCNLDR